MKSFDSPDGKYQQIAQAYAGMVRVVIGLTVWTFVALVGLAAAFLAGRLGWSLLMLALRLIARI